MFGLSQDAPDDDKPSEYMDDYWLWCGCGSNAEGKWMLFYHVSRIDEAWERAKAKYHAGLLTGVTCMKVSTAMPNPNAREPYIKVLILYCGSESDEQGTLAVGRTILQQMQYTGPGCPSRYKKIFWKSDRATLQGVYSGRGSQRASSFSLPIPQPQFATTAAGEGTAGGTITDAAAVQPPRAAPMNAEQRRQLLAAAAEHRHQAAAAAAAVSGEDKRLQQPLPLLAAAAAAAGSVSAGQDHQVEVIDLTACSQ